MSPSPPPGAYRAFIALSLPPQVRDHLAGVQDCLVTQGVRARWVRPASMHLTLRFIGHLEPEKVAAVAAALDAVAVACPPLHLTVEGVGAFPSPQRARVLWMGIGGEGARLKRLQQDVEAGLARSGWPAAKREFKSHLTLARAKGRRPFDATAARRLTRCDPEEALAFTADRLILYHSRLRPDGAVYEPLHQTVLAAPIGM